MHADPLSLPASPPAPANRPTNEEADRTGRRIAVILGVIVLGAFWWIASGPSDGIVTLIAGLGFAAIAIFTLLNAALGEPNAPRK